MTQLRSVTCHMRSHSVTCYPTQVNTPRLNPSHTGRYSIYLPRRDGRLSWLDSAPAGSRSSDLSITSPTPNHCTTKTAVLHHQDYCWSNQRWISTYIFVLYFVHNVHIALYWCDGILCGRLSAFRWWTVASTWRNLNSRTFFLEKSSTDRWCNVFSYSVVHRFILK